MLCHRILFVWVVRAAYVLVTGAESQGEGICSSLLTPCTSNDECCSGLCTGREGKPKKCRFCARKKELCNSTSDCCQSDAGRYCHPDLKKCVKGKEEETEPPAVQPGGPAVENGNFEEGIGDTAVGWTTDAWDERPSSSAFFEWSPTFGINGSGGVMIRNDSANDSRYVQTVSGLVPGNQYRVTGMINLINLSYDPEGQAYECGATISRINTWDHSPCINQATTGWEFVEMVFTAESQSEAIGCRLGYYSSIVRGTMFCDDITITPHQVFGEPAGVMKTPNKTHVMKTPKNFFP